MQFPVLVHRGRGIVAEAGGQLPTGGIQVFGEIGFAHETASTATTLTNHPNRQIRPRQIGSARLFAPLDPMCARPKLVSGTVTAGSGPRTGRPIIPTAEARRTRSACGRIAAVCGG
jgi:hypothetical protein